MCNRPVFRLLTLRQLTDLETQNIWTICGPVCDNNDLSKSVIQSLSAREPAHTKWIQTSVRLHELKMLAAELHSLQNILLFQIHNPLPEEKEVEITRLESQLKMVVGYCEDFCARADKFMGYSSARGANYRMTWSAVELLDKSALTQRQPLRPFSFKPVRKFPQAVDSKVMQKEMKFLPEDIAIEKRDKILDPSGQELMQQLRSFLDRSRVILPDEDLPHQVCNWSDGLFLLFGTVMCPWFAWLSILSLNPESASALDKTFLKRLPSAATSVAGLGNAHIIAVTALASSITISTGASALPVWKACSRGRLSALVSCWLFIAFGALLWSHMGGSIVTLFLVFMPFAMGVGVASGLLWHKKMSNAR